MQQVLNEGLFPAPPTFPWQSRSSKGVWGSGIKPTGGADPHSTSLLGMSHQRTHEPAQKDQSTKMTDRVKISVLTKSRGQTSKGVLML
jgi:hypothetical protein